MPNAPSSRVAQRRFWNTLADDKPGIIWITNISAPDKVALYADGKLVYTGVELATGPLPFPPEFKLARTWTWTYDNYHVGLSSVDYDGTGGWLLKPYSTDTDPFWNEDNLMFDASSYKKDASGNIATTLHYLAKINWVLQPPRSGLAFPWVYGTTNVAQGWGDGGYLYGYLNNHYFGNNEMGGNKPNEGVGPQKGPIKGDLSKTYSGLWGAFGLAHGVFLWSEGWVKASWEFDLCGRASAMAVLNFNNEIAHTNTDAQQSEGWGTDVVAVHDNVIELAAGGTERYARFTVDVSPSRGTFNVYTMKGEMLEFGTDYVNDPCDRSGRSYRLLREQEVPTDPCTMIHSLIVTYLVTAPTLSTPKNPGRVTDPNTGANRRDINDIRGL